ncbi:MAG: DUF4082 domain-containing protein, partial [Hyphomicrobiaceae bacterium]
MIDEGEREQVLDGPAVELGLEVPIEGGHGLAFLEAAALDAPFDGALTLDGRRLSQQPLEGLELRSLVLFEPGQVRVDVEAFQDRAVTLPPLNHYLTRDLIGRTRVARLLGAFRNRPPVDMVALENVLLRLSEMVCELPWLAELDINPLLVDEHGALALDARVIIAPRVPSADRYGHMAIHPYPAHLVTHWQLPSGENVLIRPIRPEDAELTQNFVRSLSEEAKYFRFMDAVKELSPAMLARLTQIDYTREMALLAVAEIDGQEVELGMRFSSTVSGYISGIRFYKSAANTGTHTGSLWTNNGQLLATGTFTGESASGWQQLNFATPVAITANTNYIASYHTTT